MKNLWSCIESQTALISLLPRRATMGLVVDGGSLLFFSSHHMLTVVIQGRWLTRAAAGCETHGRFDPGFLWGLRSECESNPEKQQGRTKLWIWQNLKTCINIFIYIKILICNHSYSYLLKKAKVMIIMVRAGVALHHLLRFQDSELSARSVFTRPCHLVTWVLGKPK